MVQLSFFKTNDAYFNNNNYNNNNNNKHIILLLSDYYFISNKVSINSDLWVSENSLKLQHNSHVSVGFHFLVGCLNRLGNERRDRLVGHLGIDRLGQLNRWSQWHLLAIVELALGGKSTKLEMKNSLTDKKMNYKCCFLMFKYKAIKQNNYIQISN